MIDHRNVPGLAKDFWDVIDRITGKSTRRKVGTAATLGGVGGLGIDLLADGGLGLLAIPSISSLVAGLVLRFWPEKKPAQFQTEFSADAPEVVESAKKLDYDKLTETQQQRVEQELGMSAMDIVRKVSLLEASAKELAAKLGDRFNQLYTQLKSCRPEQLGKKDKKLLDMLEYAAALRINEAVSAS